MQRVTHGDTKTRNGFRFSTKYCDSLTFVFLPVTLNRLKAALDRRAVSKYAATQDKNGLDDSF